MVTPIERSAVCSGSTSEGAFFRRWETVLAASAFAGTRRRTLPLSSSSCRLVFRFGSRACFGVAWTELLTMRCLLGIKARAADRSDSRMPWRPVSTGEAARAEAIQEHDKLRIGWQLELPSRADSEQGTCGLDHIRRAISVSSASSDHFWVSVGRPRASACWRRISR